MKRCMICDNECPGVRHRWCLRCGLAYDRWNRVTAPTTEALITWVARRARRYARRPPSKS